VEKLVRIEVTTPRSMNMNRTVVEADWIVGTLVTTTQGSTTGQDKLPKQTLLLNTLYYKHGL
jgi:hypothetical protein